ncbi:MAG: PQQ-like beta-propeller repeat protein [Gemmataceae bacterium]|nr:PQQ-like beta-propeller repeat protein [Gemmataceae bacterium]
MSNTLRSADAPPKRAYVLGLPFWIYIVIATGAAVLIFQTLIHDQGMANGMTWPVLSFGAFLCLVWFTLFSSYPRRIRWSIFGLCLMAAGAVATAVRVDNVSGNLFLTLAWRWSPRPIERELPPPAPDSLDGANVDLFTTTPADFPQFLGPKRDLNITSVKLDPDWSAHPPAEVWRQPIGAGWSGFVAVNGYAVTMEQRRTEELVTCYHIETGELQWVHATPTRYEHFMGGVGPRSTPTIHQGRVYALGATGKFHCLDGATGRAVWSKDLLKEFGVTGNDEDKLVRYGRSGSPLIVDDVVIVPAGGPRAGARWSLAAFHQDNGALVWKGGDHNISHASPALAVLAGRRQILSVNENWVSGHDLKTGAQLWQFEWPGTTSEDANNSQAVPLPPDRVFVSKGYGAGAKLVRLVAGEEGAIDVEPIYHKPRSMRTKLTNVTIRDGYVYGLSDGILECVELDTGRIVWREGRYSHGQILRVDDLLLVLSEDGELSLVRATPDEPNHVLGTVAAVEGQTWNNLALYGPYLLVRNAREAVCYRLALRE